VTVADDLAWR